MNESIPADIRPMIERLVTRAREDDTFAHRLREDPETMLSAEGFTDEVLETLTRELGDEDVEGFHVCDRITCILTWCTFWTD